MSLSATQSSGESYSSMSSAYLDKNHKIYHTGDGQVVRPGPRSFPFSSAL